MSEATPQVEEGNSLAKIELQEVDRSVAERVQRIIKAVADKDVGRRTKFLEAELKKMEDGLQEQVGIVERNRTVVAASAAAIEPLEEDDPMRAALENDVKQSRYHLLKAEGILEGLVGECESISAQIDELKAVAAGTKKRGAK